MSVYNFKLNTIFIHIPRTAGASMETLFGLRGHENIMFYKTFFKHLSVGINWDTIYKVAFVRNPYTRYVSAYNHLKPKQNINKFTKDLKNWYYTKDKYTELLFRPQWRFITNWGYDNQMDFIGRFENLKDDWGTICNRLNVTHKLPHLNRSKGNQTLNKESKEIIKQKYNIDFGLYYKEVR